MYPTGSIIGAVFAAMLLATALATGLARLSFPLPQAGRRIGCVDGLRGYLALFVMAHHFVVWLQITRLGGAWQAPGVPLFNEFGAGAVALFFMTTGLVFYPRVLDGVWKCDWPAIYISRVFRLLPATVLSVALVLTLIALRTGRSPSLADLRPALIWISAKAEPPLLGYADSGRLNGYVLWSLHFEWIFYLLALPLCALLSVALQRLQAPSWLTPVILAAASLLSRAVPAAPAVFNFLPSFAIGMLGYEVFRRPALARLLRHPVAGAIAASLLAIGMVEFETPHGIGLVFFGPFFLCVAAGNSFAGLLTTPGALVLGECSFSIYLLHGLVLDILFVDLAAWLNNFSVDRLPVLMVAVAAPVVLAAALSFLIVERPAIRFGAWLSRQMKAGRSQLLIGFSRHWHTGPSANP